MVVMLLLIICGMFVKNQMKGSNFFTNQWMLQLRSNVISTILETKHNRI